jgi:protein TonB
MRSSLDDIVFVNRNRSYGAYVLRRRQPFILSLVVLVTISVFMIGAYSLLIYYSLPEVESGDEWIEYDQVLVSNPYQSDYLLNEPPEGHEKVEETSSEISVDPDVSDILIADNSNNGLDSTGTGQDSTSGLGPGSKDTTDRTAFNVNKDPTVVYDLLTHLDVLPSFPGGEKARITYFHKQVKYPKFAMDNKIQGVVYVNFIVEPDSSISNISILQGIGAGCDDEAIRAVREMPEWIPGQKNGRAVRVQITMPLTFSLATTQ